MTGDTPELRSDGPCGRAQLLERLAVLLGEIEALSQRADEVPPPLLTEMYAILEKARRVLENCGQRMRGAATEDDGEGDPQPDIDRDILERMYRALGTGRPPPKQ